MVTIALSLAKRGLLGLVRSPHREAIHRDKKGKSEIKVGQMLALLLTKTDGPVMDGHRKTRHVYSLPTTKGKRTPQSIFGGEDTLFFHTF